jgi:hypothetical protein
MSCFIVSNETIGRVALATDAKGKYNERLSTAFEEIGYDLFDVERLAKDLFNFNVDAFCERYPAEETSPTRLIGIATCRTLLLAQRTRYPEDIPEFEFIPFTGKLDRAALIQAHKSACCLSYQCSEGDVPERPLYKALKKFIRDLERDLVTNTPEWEEALWG